MFAFSVTVRGPIPSKKNSRAIFVRGGRIVNIPNQKYTTWHKEALEDVKRTLDGMALVAGEGSMAAPASGPVWITIALWSKDRRASDLTNKAESVMDLLVDVGLLPDDNWNVVPAVKLLYQGVDRDFPRAEVRCGQMPKDESDVGVV